MSRTLDRSQGNFEAMPVSDGAPIVESGSNADGEWTKWADGTQTVGMLELLTEGAGAGSFNRAVYNLPIPFNSAIYSEAVSQEGVPNGANGWLVISIEKKFAAQFEMVLTTNVGWTSPTTVGFSIIATGRWK